MLQSVLFQAKHNPQTASYDINMIIQEGSIDVGREQQVYPQQITLIVPTGTNMPKYLLGKEPKQGHFIPATQTVERSNSNYWINSNRRINPICLPGFDAYSYNTSPSGSWWCTAKEGDSIPLFSIPFGGELRLWNNYEIKGIRVDGGDPDSYTDGMAGCDYNNGINMPYHEGEQWYFQQVYNGNFIS